MRLIWGEGGTGKTRLLLEWCRRLAAQGWATGFLMPGSGRDGLRALFEGVLPRLAVIDYAETRHADVRWLVERMARLTDGPKLRVVLVARRAGWWEELARSAEEEVLPAATPPLELPPVAPAAEGRSAHFAAAARAFAGRLPWPRWSCGGSRHPCLQEAMTSSTASPTSSAASESSGTTTSVVKAITATSRARRHSTSSSR